MKLVLGYIASFLLMTVVVTVIVCGIFVLLVGMVAFVTWSLPSAQLALWLSALRVCVAIGVFMGVWFICSKEVKESAKKFVNDYLS